MLIIKRRCKENKIKNVNVFVRGICITQRKIISNIFDCNVIICLCNRKWTTYLTSSKNGDNLFVVISESH